MPDLAALADPAYRVKKGPECSIPTILAALPPDQAEFARLALANPHAPGTEIARSLADLGHKVAVCTVQRHRRGDCRCPE